MVMLQDAALPSIAGDHLPRGGGRARSTAPSVETTLAAVDIVAFGDRYRDIQAQLEVRHTMYEQLIEAFAAAGLPWWACHREDRGDGVLIVAPSDTKADDFLDPLAHHLATVLERHNRVASDARLQLRIAVHHGHVQYDAYGVTGQATTHLFRLLEARGFKKALRVARTDLGMIISDRLYVDAIQRGGTVSATNYQQVRLTCKESRNVRAWLWLSQFHPDMGRKYGTIRRLMNECRRAVTRLANVRPV